MTPQELKAIQNPLKEQYRSDPSKSVFTLHAQGKLGDHVSCKVDTGRALVEAGLHKATGGSGLQACSGDMLLEALAACAGVTLQAVATSLGLNIRSGDVFVDGDLDFSGTLGVSKEVPVGFQKIRVRFSLSSDADSDQLSTLKRLTERYCVVYQTINKGTPITTEIGQA